MRGRRPERSGSRPHRHLPLGAPPAPASARTPENSPSLQAQDVQEGETDSEGRRDRGYLLGRNHLCNMPYFKPDHGSRLSGCPEQGARRGQSSARRAHTRAHTGPRSLPPSASLAELPMWMESDVHRSTPFHARTPQLPGWWWLAFAGKLSKFFPTLNSGAQGRGLPARGGAHAPPLQAHHCPRHRLACTSRSRSPSLPLGFGSNQGSSSLLRLFGTCLHPFSGWRRKKGRMTKALPGGRVGDRG